MTLPEPGPVGDAANAIMAEDPAVRAGVLSYEAYPTVSFPGSTLPAR